eukprot:5999926-Prymnesium_polylepis.1
MKDIVQIRGHDHRVVAFLDLQEMPRHRDQTNFHLVLNSHVVSNPNTANNANNGYFSPWRWNEEERRGSCRPGGRPQMLAANIS